MRRTVGILMALGLLLTAAYSPVTIAQQDVCPVIVNTAVEAVDAACAPTGRNQACYGNIDVSATPREGVAEFVFAQTGDLEPLADIAALSLSQLDEVTQRWGVVLMRVQANLPATLPGQNVLVVLFGDLQVENAVTEPLTELIIEATAGANIRRQPATDAEIALAVADGAQIVAVGRTANNNWLRVQLEDGSEGWTWAANFVPAEAGADITALPVVEVGVPLLAPMQAFYFQSGIGMPTCASAPPNGLLVQTPEGVRRVQLTINGVEVQLGSTAFLETRTLDGQLVLSLSLLEGSAQVSAEGARARVPVGTRINIPLDADLNASGQPGRIEPYDLAQLETLPLALLDREVSLAPALTAGQIDQFLAPRPAAQVEPAATEQIGATGTGPATRITGTPGTPPPSGTPGAGGTSGPTPTPVPGRPGGTPTVTSEPVIGFFPRDSDNNCRTNENLGTYCIQFQDGFQWQVQGFGFEGGSSLSIIDGQQVEVYFVGSARFAHVLGTNLVYGPY